MISTNMGTPKNNLGSVAVIIPSYNYGRFLREAIESVLSQTIQPDEILISDDFSTDHTFAIAYEYHKKYPALITINRNEQNLGIVKHFNRAVSLTKSDYICFLGADNIMPPNYLEATSKILNSDPNTAIAYTNFEFFGPRSKIIYDTFIPEWKYTTPDGKHIINFPEFNDSTKKLLFNNKNFIHGSSLYRRNAFELVGGYKDLEYTPEDFNLFLRIINLGLKASKADTFLYYRQHSEEQQNIKLGFTVQIKELSEQIEKLLQQIEKLKIEKAKEIDSIYQSRTYRFGYFLLYPLKKIKGFVKNV